MARFEVNMTEVIEHEQTPDPLDPTPEVRSVFWAGEADDEAGARHAAYVAWDAKYGPGKQPIQALVNVAPLASRA
jgi:hypothetical protein